MKIIAISIPFLVSIVSASLPVDSPPVKIGLALSGGAALGFAHIGVLKVLEREGIPISYISGNSMGSMVGGVYAAGYRATQIESIAVNADWSTLFSSNVPFGAQYLPERQQGERYIFQLRHRGFFPALPSGLVSLQNVEFLLMKLLSEIEYNTYYNFDNLPIPYRAVAVDLITGKKVILRKGRLGQAIRASIAIPGVFAPEKLAGQELVDGGVQQYLPVDPLLEFKPDFIIAVLTMKHNPETGVSLIDVISRTMDVVSIEDLNRQKKLANVLIEPNVDLFLHSDFARAKELIAAGEKAAAAALPEIRAKLAGRTLASQRKQIPKRPPVVVRSAHFEGLRVTKANFLRRELKTRPGNYLQFDQLISDLVRLFNTGLFTDVNYRLEEYPGDSVAVIFELEERAYGFYSLGIRYDNIDNIGLGLEVGQGNLLGSGASIRGVLHLGNPSEARLGITGTRIFWVPFGYRLDGFFNSRDHAYYENGKWQAGYNINTLGGIAEAGYILGQNSFFNVGIKARQITYRKPALPYLEPFPERERLIGPSGRWEFNNFNNLHLPTRGFTYRLTGFYASRKLKSTDNFLKGNFFSERIIPLTPSLLLHSGFEVGISWGKLSLAEYFRSGGLGFIGFAPDEFTTTQKAIVRLSMNFRLFQLFNRSDYPFYGQLFFNIATFEKLNKLIGKFDIYSLLNWGSGLGVRTNSPLGPCQFIFGVGDFAKPKTYPGIRFNSFLSIGRDFRYPD